MKMWNLIMIRDDASVLTSAIQQTILSLKWIDCKLAVDVNKTKITFFQNTVGLPGGVGNLSTK